MPAKHKALFPAIMTAAAFLCFLLTIWLLYDFLIRPAWWLPALFLFPTAVLLVLTLLTRSGVCSAMMGNVLTVVLSVLFLMVSAAGLIFLWFRAAAKPLTDTALYAAVMQRHSAHAPELLGQFPPEIPAEAGDVQFHYQPQLLQGAGEHRLSCTLSEAAAQPLLTEWDRNAVWKGDLSSLPSSPLADFGAAYIIRPYVADDAVVWVFLAAPYRPDSWNHGRLALAARSTDGRTLLYSSVW